MRRHLFRRLLWCIPLAIVALVAVGFFATRHEDVAMCAFHGWRLVHDLRHRHPGWSTVQLWEAVHRCARV